MVTLAILASALGACAAIEGLDQYTNGDCSQDCDDGGLDGTHPHPDAAADDGDATSGFESGSGSDSGGTLDGDDGVAPGGDASGCGPVTSVDNCGACGVQCNMMTGTPSCTGATCTYACVAGHSDCNTAPPNTDGCECATPACCGAGCQTSHADGVGQSYFDCNPAKTYTESSAIAACTAYALSVGSTAASCKGPLYCSGSMAPTICFSTTSGQCSNYCWQYAGTYSNQGPGTVWDCACPAHMIGTWN